MIKDIKSIVASGIESYAGKPVVFSKQNEEMPEYPYISYTITTHASRNNGTYEEYEDGTKRKLVTQIWSITSNSDNYEEAVSLAEKAHEWLDLIGGTILSDNNVVVQSVGDVTDRSNVITIDYQYSFGFDCFFYVFDEITTEVEEENTIEEVVLGESERIEHETDADMIDRLLGVSHE